MKASTRVPKRTDRASALLSALKSKEVLIPAAISAAGGVAATAGPGLLRRAKESTEQKSEEEAETSAVAHSTVRAAT